MEKSLTSLPHSIASTQIIIRVLALHSKATGSELLCAIASRAPRNHAHVVELQVTADDGSTTLRNRHCERRVGNVRMGEAIPLLQRAHDVTHKRINVNGEELDLVAAFHRLNADYYSCLA